MRLEGATYFGEVGEVIHEERDESLRSCTLSGAIRRSMNIEEERREHGMFYYIPFPPPTCDVLYTTGCLIS